jgi:TrmH family RNA methyltransferase
MTRTLRVSRPNSAYQVLASLRANRVKRHRLRQFIVEGVQPINTALDRGWPMEAIVTAHGRHLSPWALGVLERAAPPLHYELSGDLFGALSGKTEPSELLAILRMPEDSLERIRPTPDLLAAVIDRPSNPGNLGTLVRSSDAFGVHGVAVVGHGVDVYDPATITASRGSLFAVPVVRAASADDIMRWVANVRTALGTCLLAGADEHGEVDIDRLDLAQPVVIVFGNETTGLSRAWQERCDILVRIPMRGSASSLNVAAAGSVLFYEAMRQRKRGQFPLETRR